MALPRTDVHAPTAPALWARAWQRPVRAAALLLATAVAVPSAVGVLTVDAASVGITSGPVTVTGSGFGHGVGLSQYGALGMARDGASATQILEHYYTGVDVAPYTDAVDVRVNVVNRGRSVTLTAAVPPAQVSAALAAVAPKPTAKTTAKTTAKKAVRKTATKPRSAKAATPSPAGTLVLLTDSGALTLGPGDRAVVTPSSGRLAVTVTAAAGTTPTTTTTTTTSSLGVQWAGTRDLPGDPTVLSVLSSREGAAARRLRTYRWGALTLTPVGSGIEGVLTLDLHSEYLRGLAEVPASWPAAALQAQAIAARNYALVAARTTPRASCGGCQLWDDTRSQVYLGWAKETEGATNPPATRWGQRWAAAIAATQPSATTGLAVLYQGRPVVAYYASSTGGRTRDVRAVWGSDVPYLRSVADPWSVDRSVNPSFARWTRTTSVPRLAALFGLKDLASVTVTARDAAGAAVTVTAVNGDGVSRSVSGARFARAFGLPAAWISSITLPVTSPPSPSSPPSPPQPSGSPTSSPGSSPSPSPSGSS